MKRPLARKEFKELSQKTRTISLAKCINRLMAQLSNLESSIMVATAVKSKNPNPKSLSSTNTRLPPSIWIKTSKITSMAPKASRKN